MRYATLLAVAPLLLFASCTAVPSFSVGTVVDASRGESSADGSAIPGDEVTPEGATPMDDGGPHIWRPIIYHVFVTHDRRAPAQFKPPLTGIDAADSWCRDAGASINSDSRWVAYLATGTRTSDGPKNRLLNPPQGFYSVATGGGSPMPVFADIRAAGALPQSPINDETGKPIDAIPGATEARVWIGSTEASDGCDSWRSEATGLATCGDAKLQDFKWETFYKMGCSTPAHIYCFEQDPLP